LRADLHVHTTASDGSWTPEQVVRGAVQGGLDLIAITDHDTVAGAVQGFIEAASASLRIVPAVELSTTRDRRDLHILGYRVDLDAPTLRAHEERARGARMHRMETMVTRLQRAGLTVTMDAVLAAASHASAAVGRPHLARALVAAGEVRSIDEAFDRYIGDGLPAFEPTTILDPVAAIELTRAAGGFAVWAHPPWDLLDRLLPEMVRAGLRGLEAYRPLSTGEQIRRVETVVRSAGLLATGGSDWHSWERNGPLGSFYLSADRISPFLEAVGI
jgi:predicted metal-dependent phosphoesterase TrpH